MNVVKVCEEMRPAIENLRSAGERIETTQSTIYSTEEVREITDILPSVFWAALPHFVEGREQNPIYHNTQVLDNMVRIGLGEHPPYREFKNAVLLALVHDIGNAVSRRPKFKTDEVVAAFQRGTQEGIDTALKAVAFRLEHMDNGPELARDVLSSLVRQGKLRDDDVHLIGRAITVHDYPSVETVLKGLADKTQTSFGYVPGDFLLAFDNSPFGRLIMWLREADRLFMLSEQGVIKDVRDGLDGDDEPTAEALLAKLQSNANKHAEEFDLYKLAGRADGFREETLYRTQTGHGLFAKFLADGRARWAQVGSEIKTIDSDVE